MSDASAPGAGFSAGRGRFVAAAIAALAITAVVFLLLSDDGGGSGAARLQASAASGPRLAGIADLRSLSASLGRPLYWAGTGPGKRMELTDEADGRVYIRYLGPGVRAGDPRPLFLTVGTYPVPDARAAIERTARQPGASLRHIAAGGIALVNARKPTSVYIAYPRSDTQIEVFDPAPGNALRLVLSGQVTPVG